MRLAIRVQVERQFFIDVDRKEQVTVLRAIHTGVKYLILGKHGERCQIGYAYWADPRTGDPPEFHDINPITKE